MLGGFVILVIWFMWISSEGISLRFQFSELLQECYELCYSSCCIISSQNHQPKSSKYFLKVSGLGSIGMLFVELVG